MINKLDLINICRKLHLPTVDTHSFQEQIEHLPNLRLCWVRKQVLTNFQYFILFYFIFFFLIFYLFIYLFMAVLGLRFCARTFSSCGKWGPLLIAVRGPLTVAASLVAEHRLQTYRLSNCGSRAQSLRGMWDPPRPGLEPVSPALAGRPPTTAPPGKPSNILNQSIFSDYRGIELEISN